MHAVFRDGFRQNGTIANAFRVYYEMNKRTALLLINIHMRNHTFFFSLSATILAT